MYLHLWHISAQGIDMASAKHLFNIQNIPFPLLQDEAIKSNMDQTARHPAIH